MNSEIIVADARDLLNHVAPGSVQTCITSPPYFAQRTYGTPGELGREQLIGDYVTALVDVLSGPVRDALADDGTLWLNLGDAFNNRTRIRSSTHQDMHGVLGAGTDWRDRAASGGIRMTRDHGLGLKEKDLIGVPWRVAFALQASGWYLRSEIIWAKSFTMPDNAPDRPNRAHEQVFLLSKSKRYFYDREGVKRVGRSGKLVDPTTIWTLPPGSYKGHSAVMPAGLIEPCVLAGSAPGDLVLDPFAGSGTVGMVANQHGRRFLGVELNPEYAELARQRLAV